MILNENIITKSKKKKKTEGPNSKVRYKCKNL